MLIYANAFIENKVNCLNEMFTKCVRVDDGPRRYGGVRFAIQLSCLL